MIVAICELEFYISQIFFSIKACATERRRGWGFILLSRWFLLSRRFSKIRIAFFHKLRLIVHTKSVRQHVVLRDVPISTTGCRTTSTLRNGIATDIVRRVSQSDLWQPVIAYRRIPGRRRSNSYLPWIWWALAWRFSDARVTRNGVNFNLMSKILYIIKEWIVLQRSLEDWLHLKEKFVTGDDILQ